MAKILSRPCHIASHQGIAISKEGEEKLHSACPGGCVEAGGRVLLCECECHGGTPETVEQAIALAYGDPLPTAVTVLEPGVDPARKNHSAPSGRAAPTGRCEHCGAPTGARFAPGHDAKLKSQLYDEARRRGNFKSWAELHLRGWTDKAMKKKVNFEVQARGEAFADQHGYQLVERRNEVRQRG